VRDLAALVACCYRDGLRSGAGNGWTLKEIARGHNGIVFRARSSTEDLAAKVSQVDERGRAAREAAALELLSESAVAPRLVGVVHESEGIAVDVLLTGWCDGAPVEAAPSAESPVWSAIVRTYARVHRLEARGNPAVLGVDLAQVVDDMRRRATTLKEPPRALIEAARRDAASFAQVEQGEPDPLRREPA
jgi:hypothetical protein